MKTVIQTLIFLCCITVTSYLYANEFSASGGHTGGHCGGCCNSGGGGHCGGGIGYTNGHSCSIGRSNVPNNYFYGSAYSVNIENVLYNLCRDTLKRKMTSELQPAYINPLCWVADSCCEEPSIRYDDIQTVKVFDMNKDLSDTNCSNFIAITERNKIHPVS